MKRRHFLTGALVATVAGGAALTWPRSSSRAQVDLATANRLAMPPLLDTSETGRVGLTAQAGETDFLGGAPTRTIGYNQAYLGPTIRMQNGPLAADVQNSLNHPVTVHWHGLMAPGEHDGGPHLAVRPGGEWTPDMEVRQEPCTALYHTHVHERTAADVYAGLAGAIQVSDGKDDERGLPSQYGVDDLTLVLQDRRFDGNGRMVYGLSMMDVMHGFTGNVMLINGQANAVAAVPKGIVRLRLINASNARIYTLFAEDGRTVHLTATDGGYLPAPITVEKVRLSPGERVELLVDFSDRRPMVLMSGGDPNQGPGGMMGRMRGMVDRFVDRSFAVLSFAVDDRLPTRITRLPADLGGTRPDLESVVSTTRRFSLDMGMGGMMGGGMMRRGMMGGFAINGRPFDMRHVDFDVKLGTTERWIVSAAMLAHPFHVHGALFQVVREDGSSPRPENRGWKDTVLVESESELLVRFDQPAGSDTPFMYHCHILEHEDGGMMGQFTVT